METGTTEANLLVRRGRIRTVSRLHCFAEAGPGSHWTLVRRGQGQCSSRPYHLAAATHDPARRSAAGSTPRHAVRGERAACGRHGRGVVGVLFVQHISRGEALRDAKEVTPLAGEGIVAPAVEPAY